MRHCSFFTLIWLSVVIIVFKMVIVLVLSHSSFLGDPIEALSRVHSFAVSDNPPFEELSLTSQDLDRENVLQRRYVVASARFLALDCPARQKSVQRVSALQVRPHALFFFVPRKLPPPPATEDSFLN